MLVVVAEHILPVVVAEFAASTFAFAEHKHLLGCKLAELVGQMLVNIEPFDTAVVADR